MLFKCKAKEPVPAPTPATVRRSERLEFNYTKYGFRLEYDSANKYVSMYNFSSNDYPHTRCTLNIKDLDYAFDALTQLREEIAKHRT